MSKTEIFAVVSILFAIIVTICGFLIFPSTLDGHYGNETSSYTHLHICIKVVLCN